MRKNILSLAVLATLATAGIASAAANNPATPFDDQQTDGFVVSVASDSVTLNDGKTYQLPVGYVNSGLAAGQKVYIDYSITSGTYQAGYVSLLPNN